MSNHRNHFVTFSIRLALHDLLVSSPLCSAVVNESYFSLLSVEQPPFLIAMAAVYIACRAEKLVGVTHHRLRYFRFAVM